MKPKTSTPESAFAVALESFQTGGVTYADFLAQVKLQLAAGATPARMMDVLRRAEFPDPLPRYAHEAVMELLNGPKAPEPAPPAAPEFAEAATIVLGEIDDGHASVAPVVAANSVATYTGDSVPLGRFNLIELIGEGGMSRVYKAFDPQPLAEYAAERFIAVKVLTRPFDEPDAVFASLQEELRRLRDLHHPNIVRMFSCERAGDSVFLTMEYLTGQSLFATLGAARNGRPLDGASARSVITAVADALDFAHRNLVVHGDLKPGNVIVTDRNQVKIIDFGLPSWTGRPKTALERRENSQAKMAVATPRYASPQLMARQKPEPTDDVYALACLAYELLSGRHPFEVESGALTARFPPPLLPGMTTQEYAALVNGLQRERATRTPTIRRFTEEFAQPAPRSAWPARALWASAVLIVLAGVWYFARQTRHEQPVPSAADSARTSRLTTAAVAAASKPGSVIRDCPTCPLMTVLPPGKFLQGTPRGDRASSPFEQPQHAVTIERTIALSANDVTVGDFREFIAETDRDMQGCDIYDGEWRHLPKASWKDPGFVQSSLHPVTCTSWNDATAYAQWLSAKTAQRYRLPSAAEWEYAARAGGSSVRPWDSNGASACTQANVADQTAERYFPGWDSFSCDDGYVYTSPVGSFKANAYGLNDTLGNVFQWTQDCWNSDYGGAPADGSARTDGDCSEHELRGGSWFSSPSYVRTSYRNHFAADTRASSIGFRLVREVTP